MHHTDTRVEAATALRRRRRNPYNALAAWLDQFVDLLVTKHGLAGVLQSDRAGFDALHALFLDRLLPACAGLLDAAASAGSIRADVTAYELLRGIGNLCIGSESDDEYDARRLVGLLVRGLAR